MASNSRSDISGSGALFLARRDQFDLVAHVVQRVEDADVAVAADAEHEGHTLLNLRLGDQLAAFHDGHGVPRDRWFRVRVRSA